MMMMKTTMDHQPACNSRASILGWCCWQFQLVYEEAYNPAGSEGSCLAWGVGLSLAGLYTPLASF